MVEKIVLDAGHGGRNPGAAYQGRRESDDALRLAVAVGNILEENYLHSPERFGLSGPVQRRADPDL